jgi:hypothetical protein
MKNPMPRMQMLHGFNEGWIAFEGDARKGSVGIGMALRTLVDHAD